MFRSIQWGLTARDETRKNQGPHEKRLCEESRKRRGTKGRLQDEGQEKGRQASDLLDRALPHLLLGWMIGIVLFRKR